MFASSIQVTRLILLSLRSSVFIFANRMIFSNWSWWSLSTFCWSIFFCRLCCHKHCQTGVPWRIIIYLCRWKDWILVVYEIQNLGRFKIKGKYFECLKSCHRKRDQLERSWLLHREDWGHRHEGCMRSVFQTSGAQALKPA